MSLINRLFDAVRSWRRPVGRKGRRRAEVRIEHLDHRRLMAANFTGIATTDIPQTSGPGFAIVNNPNPLQINNPALAADILVSGFAIDAIRMRYDPTDDTLSVAIQQPLNQKTNPQYPVIAGDADNNQNSGGTPNAAVLAAAPLFHDYYDLGGSETMAVFFDFNNDGIPDVVAGVPNTPGAGKLFTVSKAVVSSNAQQAATSAPAFGEPLPSHTGYAFLKNSVTQPAFEFTITNFSKLYTEQTGQPFTTSSTMGVGAFAGSNTDFIKEEYVPEQVVNFDLVPPPPPPPPPPHVCPPASPQIQINPHQNRHVNTAHPEMVRVSIFGTSGFDVNSILPGTVTLGGAKPLGHFTRHINHDQFQDVTYLFRGDQIKLAPGITPGAVTGQYVDSQGQTENFLSAQTIYNKDASFYSPAQQALQQRRESARGVALKFPTAALERKARENHVDLVIDQGVSAQKVTANQVTANQVTASPVRARHVPIGRTTVSNPVKSQSVLVPNGITGIRSGVAVPAGMRVRATYKAQASGYPNVRALVRELRAERLAAHVRVPTSVASNLAAASIPLTPAAVPAAPMTVTGYGAA